VWIFIRSDKYEYFLYFVDYIRYMVYSDTLFRDPCTPIIWIAFPFELMRFITVPYFCHFVLHMKNVIWKQIWNLKCILIDIQILPTVHWLIYQTVISLKTQLENISQWNKWANTEHPPGHTEGGIRCLRGVSIPSLTMMLHYLFKPKFP
jgi:hypothetical protein